MAVETETPTHGSPDKRAPALDRRDASRNSLWLTPVVLTMVPLAVLVALWLAARSWSARTGDPRAVVTALSSFSALAGTVLLATTIVLSARLRLLERRVGGLDRVYRLHHWLGGVAFTLVALHPVLLAWRNATTSWSRAARVWWPITGDWALAAGQLALYAVAVALTVTVFVRVRHQLLMWLQRILGAAFLVAAYHVLSVGGVVSSYRPLRWYVIGVLAAGVAALAYHTLLGRLLTRHHAGRRR